MSRAGAWLVALLVIVASACRPGPAQDRPTAATTVVSVVETAPPTVVAAVTPVDSPTPPAATPSATATPVGPAPSASPPASSPSATPAAPTPARPSATPTPPATPVIPATPTVATIALPAPIEPTSIALAPAWQYRSGTEVSGARGAVLVLGLDRGGRVVNFGTGISVGPDGLILTTSQAVQGAAQLVVRHPDSPAGAARLLNEDPVQGLVVLRSDTGSLPVARLGSSATARPGDPIAAVGFVSVAGGSRQVEGQLADARFWMAGGSGPATELPFAAAVTPGYSGAPLLNAGGEVIGIVTRAPAGGTFGVATPIDRARDLIARVPGASPEPAVAAPRPGIADPAGAAAEILGLVQQYYADLNAGNYQSSYSVMSESARRAQSLTTYLVQFRSLESIQTSQPVIASLDGDRAIVQLQTTTATRSGVRLYRQHWEITWYLVREGGAWRRDALDQRALSDPTPVPG